MPTDWQDDWQQGFNQYVVDLHEGVYQILLSVAPEVESEMKSEAPWTDRTSNARQGLWAEATKTETGAEINFGHGMDYGWWLEVKANGRYAIVAPTLDRQGLRVLMMILRIFG